MQNQGGPAETSKANSPNLDMNTHGQEEYKREDEMAAKAPPAITYPLDTLLQFIGNMMVTLTQARSALSTSNNHPEADKETIGGMIEKIDKINLIAITIPDDLESMRL